MDIQALREKADRERKAIVARAKARGAVQLNDDEDREFRSLTDTVDNFDHKLAEERRRQDGRTYANNIFNAATAGNRALEGSKTMADYSDNDAYTDRRHSYVKDLIAW